MFNYDAIDKTPTIRQIKTIIEYMEEHPTEKYPCIDHMMKMDRIEPNAIRVDIHNAHTGKEYEFIFDEENNIKSVTLIGKWIS